MPLSATDYPIAFFSVGLDVRYSLNNRDSEALLGCLLCVESRYLVGVKL